MTDEADRYEITAYDPEFYEDLLELQEYLWGDNRERNAAYFDWKYRRNPYSNNSFIYLVLWEGKVVGMRTMYVTEWEAGQPSQKIKCLTDADAVIHPDHRRRGLLEQMTRASLIDAADHGFEYSITLSASPASAAHNFKLGWRSVGSLETASWHPNSRGNAVTRAIAAKLPFLRLAYRQIRQRISQDVAPPTGQRLPFDRLGRGDTETGGAIGNHITIDSSPRPEAMADLIGRLGSDGRIRHTRDERFFAWRFENPLSVYRFLFWEDRRLEGYLVLQAPAGRADAWIHIVDWEATSMQVRADLLQAAIEHSQPGKMIVWSATLPEEEKKLLRAHGFHFADITVGTADGIWHPNVLIRPVCRDLLHTDWRLADRDMLDLTNWDLRAIYSDNF